MSSQTGPFRLAIVGDLHTHWDEVDVAQFSRADYDLLFFTGDLGGGSVESSLRMARLMAGLRRPALVMPGNNDTCAIDRLAAELTARSGMQAIMALARDPERTHHPTQLCGYSEHAIEAGRRRIALIAGRPHSMGGPELAFRDHMAESYGIASVADSARRLCELVDGCASDEVIFLAHNGPAGLGEHACAIWGNDFRPGGGDWGDPDLAEAIDHARDRGKRVLAVIAGHMHLRTKQGEERPWKLLRDDTLYINAARVPRIFATADDVYRHHVVLTITSDTLEAEEVLLPQYA